MNITKLKMKQLEISAEKAQEREDKLQDKILQLIDRFKVAEARYEYGEMNITKLNHRIDDIEDEIYREKLKIKKVSDELSDTFDDMLENYWICLKTIRSSTTSSTLISHFVMILNDTRE